MAHPQRACRILFVFCSSCLLPLTTAAAAAAFDRDTGMDCSDRIDNCVKDETTFFDCPLACAKALEPPTDRLASGPLDEETFSNMEAVTIDGRNIHFENLEGYVTVVAALPLLPGVAQFYYSMLSHLHDVYPYTLEILLVPLQEPQDDKTAKIVPLEHSKVNILPGPHPALLRLLQKQLRGNLDNSGDDKVTLYLINADGDAVEAFVYPTMPDFQRYLHYHFARELSKPEF